MITRCGLAVTLAALLSQPSAALADNAMGYQLLTTEQAARLPPSGGSLGMAVGQGRQISEDGLRFELLTVRSVRADSPAAAAGLVAGDQIIAVDGHVFASTAAFGGYVRSLAPGARLSVDEMPAGGGPQQAQRVAIVMGAGGRAASAQQDAAVRSSGGMSTGTKVAIGVAAVALLGCYEMGCFSHHRGPSPPGPGGAPIKP